jgi:hypothetical protein
MRPLYNTCRTTPDDPSVCTILSARLSSCQEDLGMNPMLHVLPDPTSLSTFRCVPGLGTSSYAPYSHSQAGNDMAMLWSLPVQITMRTFADFKDMTDSQVCITYCFPSHDPHWNTEHTEIQNCSGDGWLQRGKRGGHHQIAHLQASRGVEVSPVVEQPGLQEHGLSPGEGTLPGTARGQ